MSEKYVFPIEAYKQGMDDERERIITLLEDLKTQVENTSGKDWQGKMAMRAIILGVIIDRIKGENK